MPQSKPFQHHTGAGRTGRLATVVMAAACAWLGLILPVTAYNSLRPNNRPPAGDAAIGGHATLGCGQCHAIDQDRMKPGSNDLVLNHEHVCTECHSGAIEASHPSGFRPMRPLPAAFPLDAGGRMTCATCHVFHDNAPATLRTARIGEPFCRSCHDSEFFDSMTDKGESLLMAGHFDASARLSTNPDPYSLRCMICHDDRAQSSPQLAADGFTDAASSQVAGHPIGSDYDHAARGHDYRSRSLLANEMLLPNGRVACVSCHVPYSRDHGRGPRTTGGLCQECHIM